MLGSLVSTSERQLLSVLSLIIYIRSRVEERVNMEGLLGKFRLGALLGSLTCFLSSGVFFRACNFLGVAKGHVYGPIT